jgi:putative selenium metabolism hydrolase
MLDGARGKTIEGDLIERFWAEAESLREQVVDFTQRLIRTPSLPGDEGAVAEIVAAEMRSLHYDDVSIDEAGNVIGRMKPTAAGKGKRVMLNTHLDHVDVGDPARWPYPPYEGRVVGDDIWGRGASDLKGALACQVYAGALLKRLGIETANEIYVAAVVLEERGGLGSAWLAEHLPVDYVIVGEPSANKIALGHRGRFEIQLLMRGKSVHASVPADGINPLYSMSRFLLGVRDLRFNADPNAEELGPTTIAPTLFSTDQTSPNVVPGECTVVLDVRNTPGDLPENVLPHLQPILDQALMDGATGEFSVPPVTLTTYTGITRTFWGHGAFALSRDSELARDTVAILGASLRREVPTQMWRFATDAGHFIERGMQVIGFGPGYEEVIHTVDERISISMIVEGIVGNAALAAWL